MTVDAERTGMILGGAATLGSVIRNLRDLRLRVEEGLPVQALDSVARHVATNDRAAAEIKRRIVPKTTLARRQRLTLEESERLERLARITALAEEVWENEGDAHEFLHSEQPQLGGVRPIEMAKSDPGAREVENLLMKLEYSLPA
jgi:putative toxin-antitoxin system antitoxin component (TIGR02293 family)